MELIRKPIKAIKPYAKNPRRNDAAVEAVRESIERCGYCSPIVVDEDMVILAGHTRFKAIKSLGWTEVDIIVKGGLTDDQKRLFRILDNKTNELAEWDIDLLRDELDEIADLGDFDFGIVDTINDAEQAELEHLDNKTANAERNVDMLNSGKATYDGGGLYDIPMIEPVYELPEITEWIGFNYVMSDKHPEGKGVHFFIEDYQFERVWNNPDAYIDKLRQYAAVASPDFSPFADMPHAMQIWNHFRKHWLGAYWQQHGITVVATIRASTDPRSFDWYLDGEPHGGIVLISSMWVTQSPEIETIFRKEYDNMFDTLHPSKILLYGKQIDGLRGNVERLATFAEKRFNK